MIAVLALLWGSYNQWQAKRNVTFVIPAGDGQAQPAVNFPDEIVLTLGVRDTIIIENQDDVTHSFGPFVIGPNATLTKRFQTPVTYEGACTFHQNKQMRLIVNPAPWSIADW